MPIVEGIDPETGAPVRISVYVRKGRLIYQRFSDALTDEGRATAPQLQARVDFAEKALATFGQRMTGELPVAAEAVSTLRGNRPPRHSRAERERVQQRYRQMIPPELRASAEAIAAAQARATRAPRHVTKRATPSPTAAEPVVARSAVAEHPLQQLVAASARPDDRATEDEHPLKELLRRRPLGR